jgi:hypothetical protein
MAERKPERPKASQLLTATIETNTSHRTCTKLDEIKGDIVFYRREN